MSKIAKYIWLDGHQPTQELRSKSRIIQIKDLDNVDISQFPEWGFDGSSTNQADGHNSDLVLKPVNFIFDPIRGNDNFLVLCEVFNPDGTPHPSNKRAQLRKVLAECDEDHEVLVGFEQEYTLFKGPRPLGWPENGYPGPQGPYYCGVGGERVFGRDLVEEHLQSCIEANLLIYGTNAEVMPAQWEYQIGYRGFDEPADVLTTCDHSWFAAWILHRLSEFEGIRVSFDNKPIQGDWNGAGCHTNFSTKEMRDPKGGWDAIQAAIKKLKNKHDDHIKDYGYALEERLTGLHETCAIDEFRSGEADRGASIRIPHAVAEKGYGYIEDRRPGANSDPYVVCARLISTICDVDFDEVKANFTREKVAAV